MIKAYWTEIYDRSLLVLTRVTLQTCGYAAVPPPAVPGVAPQLFINPQSTIRNPQWEAVLRVSVVNPQKVVS
jgi:hypothetical protein